MIQLKRTWNLGKPLVADAGGFGRVYEATGEDGAPAVVKLVDKLPGAERELLFGDLEEMKEIPNIVPIWDSGEFGDKWALVMPKATGSLRSHLESAGGPLQLDETVEILQDIAQALVGIADIAVHRDLKPENVLQLDGSWCLADFGIARYAEASTDPATRKASFTKQYAAPEQWKYEHATAAADVYAFGIIAYEMLTGRRPFDGPDYRDQHLHQIPEELAVGTPRLRVLIEECLIKAPEARPSAQLVAEKLKSALSVPPRPGASALAELNRSKVVAMRRRARPSPDEGHRGRAANRVSSGRRGNFSLDPGTVARCHRFRRAGGGRRRGPRGCDGLDSDAKPWEASRRADHQVYRTPMGWAL